MLASARFPIAEPFAGGLEAHTWALARQHDVDGLKVTLYALPGSDPVFQVAPLPAPPVLSSDARADLSIGPEAAMGEHHAYLGAMLDIAERADEFDVVHNNAIHHLPVALAATLTQPIITTLHTPPTAWLESAILLRGPHRAGAFVAVSRATAAAWHHLLGDVPVIRNGIDLAAWSPGPGGPHAVWTGRLVPEKAPHLAIDAARRAGVGIRLAGPRHDPVYWRDEVEPRLGPDARWVGHLDCAALRRLVGGSCVTLLTPDWDEPFGLVALESLAAGTPVAAFARGGITDIVDDAGGRLVPAGEVDALAAALRSCARLDRRGVRRRAEAIGCVQRMAAEYRDVYRKLLAG
ncbi:MAG: glycosyltransferase [Acidimicrobiia bacterium]|jgi:glycosyltransferase involved in cell wall biosynthesis|nr:glycosyltransferase [Acidimicrobiia bacterium]